MEYKYVPIHKKIYCLDNAYVLIKLQINKAQHICFSNEYDQ